MSTAVRTDRTGLVAALSCFTVWGLFPLFFQAIGRAGVGSLEAVSWRIAMSAPTAGLLVLATGQWPAFRSLARQPRTLGLLAVSSALIGGNWGLYVWAVQHGETLAASFGYYVNPLLNVAVGAWLFRERLSLAAKLALALAAAGVAAEAVAIGGVPWVPLALAVSFLLYGIIRKQAPVGPQTGLFVESLILLAPCLIYLGRHYGAHGGAFGSSPWATALIVATGPITVAPLVAFSLAAKRLPLTTIGFLQFIQPTILFAVGVTQGEAVTPGRLAAFALIWAGVAIFTVDLFRRRSGA